MIKDKINRVFQPWIAILPENKRGFLILDNWRAYLDRKTKTVETIFNEFKN